MPEIEISREEHMEIWKWMSDKHAVPIVDSEYKYSDYLPLGSFLVNGEPFTIERKVWVEPLHNDWRDYKESTTLYCSDNHAGRLEEAGIVRFPKRLDSLVVMSSLRMQGSN